MKIISKFKDYYDSVSHQYLDREILYIRDSATLNFERSQIPRVDRFRVNNKVSQEEWILSFEVIGFCGELYPVILATSTNKGRETRSKCFGFYSIDDLGKFLEANNITISEKRKYRLYTSRDFGYSQTLEDIKRFFQASAEFESLKDLFQKHNTPAFVYRRNDIGSNGFVTVINPMLKNYSFSKMKDPFTAHQDLYQFVGGYLNQPEKTTVELSDKMRAEKHGFDKWSFRKLPS